MNLPTTQKGWDTALRSRADLDGKASNGEATPEIKDLFADLGHAVLSEACPLGMGYPQHLGNRDKYHGGLDLKAAAGSKVHAVVDGVVVRADGAKDGLGFDTAVVVHGDDGHYWVYGHVNDTPLDNGLVGSRVAAGEVIGTLRASTSQWIDPHVHLGVLEQVPNSYSHRLIGGYGHFTSKEIALKYTDNPLQSYHEWRGEKAALKPLQESDGPKGDDVLTRGGGRDVLHGGDGQDYLNGGAGIDHLYGHGGADRFDFDAVAHSPTANAAWDVIEDFEPGIDTIDLKSIDADTTKTGNQSFAFVAENHRGATPGEVWVDKQGGYIHASVDAKSG